MGKALPFTLRVQQAVMQSTMPKDARHLVHVMALVAKSSTGTGWHSQKTLSELTGISERHVRGLLAELEGGKGWPVRVRRRRRGREGGIGRSSDEWLLELTSQPAPHAGSGLEPQPAPGAASDGNVDMTSTGTPRNLNRQGTSPQPAPGAGDLPVEHPDRSSGSDLGPPREAGPTLVLVPSSPKAKAAKKIRKAKPEDPEHGAKHGKVVSFYFEAFERKRGSKPVGFDGADGRAVSKLLEKCKGDPDAACQVIAGAFGSWKGDTVTIRDIASNPSAFVGAARRGGPVQPNHGVVDPRAYGGGE